MAQLRACDAELEEMSVERRQYGLLQEICHGLDRLKELGGAGLFWEDAEFEADGSRHLEVVRSRVEGFEKRLGEVEAHRQAILDEIEIGEDDADLIAGEILEAERLEEERRREWEIEREAGAIGIRPSKMPWARGGEDDQRFRKALAACLLVSLLSGSALHLVELPVPDRWEPLEVPDRFARLIPREPVKPPPPDEPKSTPRKETPRAADEPAVADRESRQPAAETPSRPSSSTKGILAFRETLSGLARPSASERLGSNARISETGDTASGPPRRSLVTRGAATASGGIDVAGLSRETGGGAGQQIGGVEIARAESSIGVGSGSDRPLAAGPSAARTDEEIQIVFDRHKAALYRLYNRELRRNPTLQGQIVLRLTIEPDGSVSLCELKSTDMDAPALSKGVIERVETFDFGSKEGVPAVTIVYPIDFLPAA